MMIRDVCGCEARTAAINIACNMVTASMETPWKKKPTREEMNKELERFFAEVRIAADVAWNKGVSLS
jgi:hypothetical protein